MFNRKNKVHPAAREDSRPAKKTNNYLSEQTKTLYLCLPEHAEMVIYSLEEFTQSMNAEKDILKENRLEIEAEQEACAVMDELIKEEKISGLRKLLKSKQKPLLARLKSLALDRQWLSQIATSYIFADAIHNSEIAAVKYALRHHPAAAMSLLKIVMPLSQTEDPDEPSINSDGDAIVRIDLLKYLVSIKSLSHTFLGRQTNASISSAITAAPEFKKIDLPVAERLKSFGELATIPEEGSPELKEKPAKTFNIDGNNLIGFVKVAKTEPPQNEIFTGIKSRR
jgi:hypothetical protein